MLEDICEGDVGVILGWGFVFWLGGFFFWFDIVGVEWVVEICDVFIEVYGVCFVIFVLLWDMVVKG